MKSKFNWMSVLILAGTILIVALVSIQLGNDMIKRIDRDCAAQNFTGVKHYWDADVDCSQYNSACNIGKPELVGDFKVAGEFDAVTSYQCAVKDCKAFNDYIPQPVIGGTKIVCVV
jgi:hypothetical protein